MKDLPVAGTFRLDGMLQASLGGDPVAADLVEAWVSAAAKQGLKFHFQLEGSGFSLLGVNEVCKSSSLAGGDLENLIVDGLQSLLDQLPEAARKGVMSTIRSEEFRPGEVVQSLYSVGPTGQVISEQRILDIETEEPPPELTPASIRRYAFVAIVALVVSLVISAIFVDYRKLFTDAKDNITISDENEIKVDTTRLEDVVTVKVIKVHKAKEALILELRRGKRWSEAMASSPSESSDWGVFLMNQALHNQRVRVEFFNRKNEMLSRTEIPLDELMKKPKALVAASGQLPGLTRIEVKP